MLAELRSDAADGTISMAVDFPQGCDNGGFCCPFSASEPCANVALQVAPGDAAMPGLGVADAGTSYDSIVVRGIFTTGADLPTTPSYIPGTCTLSVNSVDGASADIEITISLWRGTSSIHEISVSGWEPEDLHVGGRVECGLRDATKSIPALDRVIEDYVRKDLCKRCGCQ